MSIVEWVPSDNSGVADCEPPVLAHAATVLQASFRSPFYKVRGLNNTSPGFAHSQSSPTVGLLVD